MTVTSVLRDWKATRYVGDCEWKAYTYIHSDSEVEFDVSVLWTCLSLHPCGELNRHC